MQTWQKAQKWEKDWHGDCANTLGEELKQVLYARKMGLEFHHDGKTPYNIDLGEIRVLDIGAGPCSLLLRCHGGLKYAVEPLLKSFPDWVARRYVSAGIIAYHARAEQFEPVGNMHFDEAWIYNVLQHAENPELVVAQVKNYSNLVRIFEWVDTPTNVGHPHSLSAAKLDEWLGGEGKVEDLNEPNYGCTGRAYYGIFPSPSKGVR